ncbi:hypothetical protein [Streptomyces sp. NPDC057877]|uniref:hypothetical protein n=1 Tax=Streptomyces sp. NPDC057877 TaxID=3346269 RepID=UPI0036B2E7A4
MPRWRLEYHLGTPRCPRSTEAEFDDLMGDGIRQAHEYVREFSERKGEHGAQLARAVLLHDQPGPGDDPLAGEPRLTAWVTYEPYDPDSDPDEDEPEGRRREAFQFPAALYETHVTAAGVVETYGPPMGVVQLAVRRRLADGREGAIIRVDLEDLV